MKKTEFSVASSFDGLNLNVVCFVPDGEVRGIVQFAHGMAEHKERYFDFMEFLTSNGFVTAIYDHRGHGESVKSPADLGFFYDESGSAVVEDAYDVTLFLKQTFPHIPFVLFGHSMGSLVVRCYAKKHDEELDALMVCGSPSENPLTSVAITLTKVIKKTKGERHLSPLLDSLTTGAYNKPFKKEGKRNAWLSVNTANVDAYNEDRFCGFSFTVNGFLNLFSLLANTYEKSGWAVKNPSLPILFIAGSADPVILNEKAWLSSIGFMQQVGYSHVQKRLFAGLRHEILNETEKAQVYNYVLGYLEASIHK